MSDRLYTVGKIVNTHGIRGELKIVPQTDFPELRFEKGSELVIETPDGRRIPVQVESSRIHKNMVLVKFKQFNDINECEKYKGSMLKVEEKYLAELDEDEYYYHEIIGCAVVTEDGQQLGTITEILSPGANDVWVVKPAIGKELLLPVIDNVVLDVDVAEKRVLVRLMEGLM
ncbi:16S rRNA processing protein RimM [Gordoniibacillus kamchatkensis]|uniref:Ribosome maturation factor RimM n=1 Tax=Gordoniibacillus kamchatkensis TaxID=1590651 RepID=A0ABR5A7M8_9BACL|nr:ribosome maturation factor RimM [Paenibacillus sp. VKM B-2647]KIL36565.1 16S rRNA processing protein RimM [Paenibacillus sp. VKM B-2647]